MLILHFVVSATAVELPDQQGLLEVVHGVVAGEGVVLRTRAALADQLVLLQLQEDSLAPMIGLVQCKIIMFLLKCPIFIIYAVLIHIKTVVVVNYAFL